MLRSVLRAGTGALLVCAGLGTFGCWPTDAEDATLWDTIWPEQVLSSAPNEPPTTSSGSSSSTPSSSPTTSTPTSSITEDRHTEVEPNNTWADADLVGFGDTIELVGTIAAGSTSKDRDIYDLGPVAAGERITAGLSSPSGSNIQLGIFDELGHILAYIDPSSGTSGPRAIDIVLRESTSRLYVMVASRTTSQNARSYTVELEVQAATAMPAPRPQSVVFVFGGASQVSIAHRNPVDVPPFDAAVIGSQFAGHTETIIEWLMDMVREDYDGLDVTFYRDSDGTIPLGNNTTIYFGTYDSRLLGLADNIDPYNAVAEQSAIIYTDTFALFNVLNPDVEAIAQVLANVASHETGHLLGLRHTTDSEGIMDVTASARQMLVDQWFKVSDLNSSVLPMGMQDAPTMLAWTVGGLLKPLPAAKMLVQRRPIDIAPAGYDFHIPRDQLMTCFCAECNAHDGDGPTGRP